MRQLSSISRPTPAAPSARSSSTTARTRSSSMTTSRSTPGPIARCRCCFGVRQVAGGMRLGLAQYRELQAFAQFGTAELDAATRRQLDLGQRLTEILKQPQFRPLTLGQEVSIIYAAVNGYLNDVEVPKVRSFEDAFHRYMESNHP